MPMSEDELKRIEDEGCGCPIKGPDCCVEALIAEVRRLRGLVERAETKGQFEHCSTCHNCPWCGYDATLDTKRRHAPECPAFTENGEVR